MKKPRCSVPQGFPLRPLVFLININDLDCLDKTDAGQFVDDNYIMYIN